MSELHPSRCQAELARAVFDPLPVDLHLVRHYVTLTGCTLPWRVHHWEYHRGKHLFDHLSVWFPPPELARQCLIGILESWVERPRSSAALLFIPRTLSRCWLGLSRHVLLIDTIFPNKTPLRSPPLLPIPVLVLYIPPHVPSLPSPRPMGATPKPKGFRRHEGAAERVRRLPLSD